jgi:hypothetical protein
LRTSIRRARSFTGLTLLLCLVSACGGGGDSTAPIASSPPPDAEAPPSVPAPVPETIQGVATPSSVSVVTATNAN